MLRGDQRDILRAIIIGYLLVTTNVEGVVREARAWVEEYEAINGDRNHTAESEDLSVSK